MNIIDGFTDTTKAAILKWFKDKCKYAVLDEKAVLQEVLDRVEHFLPGIDEPSYELSPFESKSGNPELYSFDTSDFVWIENDD